MRNLVTTLMLALVAIGSAYAVNYVAGIVQQPVFTVAEDVYEDAQYVDLLCGTEGAEIYFTLDGTTPNKESFRYDGNSIYVGSTMTLKAVAYVGDTASEVTSVQYVIAEGGTADAISTFVKGFSAIRGGVNKISVAGDNVENIQISTLSGRSINTDSDRTTTVKGSGDVPYYVVIEIDEPGYYAVKSDTVSKVVYVSE